MSFSDIILLATLIVIAWYSWETHQLKKETRRANFLNQEPIPTLSYSKTRGFFIKNDGKGMAYNVKICPIVLGGTTFSFYFSEPGQSLSPGQEKNIKIMKNNQ